MIIENETPYTTETLRLTPVVAHSKDALVGLGLIVVGAVLGVGMVGWSMLLRTLTALPVYRTLQYRGWIALACICIVVPAYTIWYSNRKRIVRTPQRMIAILWRGYCIRDDV